jgi:hypothetical protein
MNLLARVFVVFAGIALAIWGIDVARDRSTKLIVVSDSPVYAAPPFNYPRGNAPVVGVVRAGQSIQVVRTRGSKDDVAYKIEAPGGIEGWITLGEGVKLNDT